MQLLKAVSMGEGRELPVQTKKAVGQLRVMQATDMHKQKRHIKKELR